MADVVELRGLLLIASVGVLPEERERPQPLEIDVCYEVHTAEALRTDDVADAVDYGSVLHEVERVVAAEHVQLLERLADLVAEAVLAVDDRVLSVEVTVRKLRPPVPQNLRTAGVRVVRDR